MRFRLYFTLENENLPIDYRRNVISFLKLSLSEYDEEYYKKYYNQKDNIVKPYTFSVFFKNPKISTNNVVVEDKQFELNISVEDYNTAIVLYNSLNKQKYKKFSLNKNSWILQNISMVQEKEVNSDDIIVKFLSPLCVRSRKDNKDFYYSFEHKEFEETLKINIKQQLKITDFPETIVDNFKITPLNAKKVIIKFYEKQIETSTGIFKLEGDKKLLDYLYKAGIGSKHSAGFGMFQIV